MPVSDYDLYRRYYAVNPWGEERADWRAANVAWWVAHGPAKKPPEFKSFFYSEIIRPKKPLPTAVLKAQLDGLVSRKRAKKRT